MIEQNYAEVLKQWLQSRTDRDRYLLAVNSSDPRLKRLDQFTSQLVQMLPPYARLFDLGFGPEGRDMADVLELGLSKRVSVYGIELVYENIVSALTNPHFYDEGKNLLLGKVLQADIIEGIPLASNTIDGVILSSVIQHIEPPLFYDEVVPEIARILRPNGGLLQILFKRKEGESDILTIRDVTVGGLERSFWVYSPYEVVRRFHEVEMELYRGDDIRFGGVLLWDDQPRGILYAGMYMVKT